MTRTSVLLGLLAILGSQATLITNLPGAPAVTFKQYSGYYTTGTNKNHQLHYWFVESQGNPATDPVLLWLTGGPGCSGLSALLTEWGPFMVNDDGATLRLNQYGWNRNASILTLESPAGVGYSYATDGNIQTGDDQTASENWEALVAFFNEFSQYKNNDFYVTGESYGGIYVPTLVQTILDRQSQFKINIKGTAIGNGCVSENEGTDSLILFEYAHGLIDDTQWQKAKSQCCNNDTDDCPFHSFGILSFCGEFVNSAANNAWNSGINAYNMYASCSSAQSMRYAMEYRNKMKKNYIPVSQDSSPPCLDEDPVTTYLNRADVRKALFIPSSLPNNDYINQHYKRQYADMSPQLKNAVNAGLKVMIYSGDVDMACNFLMGQRFSRKLGYPVKSAAKSYQVNGQVGGFHTQYGNLLHFVTVRGAGHMVPTDKPDVAFHILDSFLNNKAF